MEQHSTQNRMDFGSPHDQGLSSRQRDGKSAEQRTGAEEQMSYEHWLQEHENEPPATEGERQLEGLQWEALQRQRTRSQRLSSQSGSQPGNRTSTRSAASRTRTAKGETRRRNEPNSEMSRL